jgi:hypothetical protein
MRCVSRACTSGLPSTSPQFGPVGLAFLPTAGPETGAEPEPGGAGDAVFSLPAAPEDGRTLGLWPGAGRVASSVGADSGFRADRGAAEAPAEPRPFLGSSLVAVAARWVAA